MNHPIPLTENDHIALIPYSHDDDSCMAACWKDPSTQRGYNNILSEDCHEFFAFEIAQFPFWVTVLVKDTGCRVGSIRLGLDQECPDLAIWIWPQFQSMGYGTASFRLALQYLFAHFPYTELSAGCYMDNERSLRMLRRIGFTRCPSNDIVEPNCFTGQPTTQFGFKITPDRIRG